jgi:hypothetical protein
MSEENRAYVGLEPVIVSNIGLLFDFEHGFIEGGL